MKEKCQIVFLLVISLLQYCYPASVDHERILKWWKQNSEQKPIKCKINPNLLEPYPKNVAKLFDLEGQNRPSIIHSRSCRENEETIFDFKGQVINEKYEGPGKLKRKKEKKRIDGLTPPQPKRENEACATREMYKGMLAETVIGTFKNGSFHGPGKVIFEDGVVLVSDFKNGTPAGMSRTFDKDGKLLTVYYENLVEKGYKWTRLHPKYLFYTDVSSLLNLHKDTLVEPNCVVIPMDMDSKEKILVGNINLKLGYLDNVHEADISIGDNDSENQCILDLNWKQKEKQDYIFFYNNDTKIPVNDFKPNCQRLLDSDNSEEPNEIESVENQFTSWNDCMINRMGTHKGVWNFLNLFDLKPEKSTVRPEIVKQPFISNLTINFDVTNKSGGILINMSIWNGPIRSWKPEHLTIDENLQPHGLCNFYITDNFGVHHMNKTGKHDFLNWSITAISGRFKHGLLNGIVGLVTWQQQLVYSTFKDGIMHGPAIAYGTVPIMNPEFKGFTIKKEMLFARPGFGFIGRFKNGQVNGPFWAGMIAGGYIHGNSNEENGLITGDDIAYIYPDGETSFKGHYENRIMKKAYNVDVLQYGIDENSGLFIVKKFSPPLNDQDFHYEPCTNISFGGGAPLHVRDPYELKTVKLENSTASPESGEGVIAKRNIPKGRIGALYSMFLYAEPDQTETYSQACTMNTSKSEDYRRHCKKYSLTLSMLNAKIDLPPELDVHPLPTLGPKVNHHFRANNSVYTAMEHPRWGMIQTVTPLRDIKAGEELFTYYGYGWPEGGPDFPEDFPWYWEAKNSIDREERLLQNKKGKKKVEKKKKRKKSADVSYKKKSDNETEVITEEISNEVEKKKKRKKSDDVNYKKKSDNETEVITEEISKKIKNVLKCQRSADILSP